MKRAWIIYQRKDAKHNRAYIKMYEEEGQKLGICFSLMYLEEFMIEDKTGKQILKYKGNDEMFPDFVVNRSRNAEIARCLELLGIKVYNSSEVTRICNNKAETYQAITKAGIPCIPTRYYKNEQLSKLTFLPGEVIKAVDGHGGAQVFEGSQEHCVINQGIGDSDFVVQPKIEGPGQDIRVYVIGNKIFAAVKRQTNGDFRANFSLGGKVSLYEMNAEEKELTQKIISQFAFSMVGIDFIVEKDGKWVFNEMEDAVGARMLYQCSNLHIVKDYLNYIISDKVEN